MRDNFSTPVKDMLAKRVGYKCSNPNCRKPTSGPKSNSNGAVNLGVAAHIKAASPGGKRYDVNQTTQERVSIENGIWLCQNCAKLVDSDEAKYSVEYFFKWKKMSEEAALLELEESGINKENAVIITSINQSGGITAHTVNIHKAPKRTLVHSMISIIDELSTFPICAYRLHYFSSDTEANNLAKEIDKILTTVKWRRIDAIPRTGGPQLPTGITFFMLKPTEPLVTLLNKIGQALNEKGVEGQILKDCDNVFKVHGWPAVQLEDGMEGVVIFIGPNPES